MRNTLFLVYLAVINVVTFVLYGVDKKRAVQDEWRIPEATLLTFTAVGGSAGALLGMQTFHHKTRKPKFKYGVPALLLVHVGLLYVVYCL